MSNLESDFNSLEFQSYNESKPVSGKKTQIKSGDISFDLNMLHPSTFRSLVEHYDRTVASATEYLMATTLVCAGAAMGKNVRLRVKHLEFSPNLWLVIIGPSSTMKKTTALNTVAKDLEKINNEKYELYKKQLAEYNKSKDENKSIPVRDYILLPQDSTIEALSDILQNSKRGVIIYSEFASCLNQLQKSYNGDSKQVLTSLYDVPESYEIVRKTKDNVLLQRPFISIAGASTIDWFKEFTVKNDLRSGFYARMLFVVLENNNKPYIPYMDLLDLPEDIGNTFNTREVYERLINLPPTAVQISPEARTLFTSYDISENEKFKTMQSDEEASFKNRLLASTLKFAMIIAVVNGRDIITKEDMEDALIIKDFFSKNIEKLLYEEIPETRHEQEENKVLAIIERHKEILRSDLLNATKYTAEQLNKIIYNLHEKELIFIREDIHPYNKKRTFYYSVIGGKSAVA